MKKYYSIILLTVLAILVIFIGIRVWSGEDDWICQNGEWVAHGHPDDSRPLIPCEK